MSSSTALICIDMQEDFLLPQLPLSVSGGLAIVPNVAHAASQARALGHHVVFVLREHDPSGVDIDLPRRKLVEAGGKGAAISNQSGAKPIAGLEPQAGDYVIVKKRASAFFATHLDLVLRRLGVQEVILSGVGLPNSVRATAVDALALDYKVTVLSDGTASRDEAAQASNLLDLSFMSITILSVAEAYPPLD